MIWARTPPPLAPEGARRCLVAARCRGTTRIPAEGCRAEGSAPWALLRGLAQTHAPAAPSLWPCVVPSSLWFTLAARAAVALLRPCDGRGRPLVRQGCASLVSEEPEQGETPPRHHGAPHAPCASRPCFRLRSPRGPPSGRMAVSAWLVVHSWSQRRRTESVNCHRCWFPLLKHCRALLPF